MARYAWRRPTSVLLVAAVVVLAWQLWHFSQQPRPPDDFVAYWAAGRLLLGGGNPYAPDQLLAVQQAVGWQGDQPMQMFYPPWGLAVVAPFGLLPYRVSRLVWLLVNLALLFATADRVWQLYGGPVAKRWLGWAVAVTFVPTLFLLVMGQASGLVLLGLVAFLVWIEQQRWAAAGAATVLVAIKPHLLYLFWPALALWLLRERRWRLLAGAAAASGLLTGLVVVLDPAVGREFLSGAPPFYWATPTLASLLRLALDPQPQQHPWPAFLPALAGVAWLAATWYRHRARWQWPARIPQLALVCLLTTPYAWSFDLVLLLPAILQAAIWCLEAPAVPWPVVGAYAVANAVALTFNRLLPNDLFLVWLTPALLVMYLWLARNRSTKEQPPP